MELYKAIKEIVASKGSEMINNIQIINFLLDYQAFKEKPATKMILRDVIDLGYSKRINAINSKDYNWHSKFLQLKQEFINTCGYKEDLALYVFDSIAYGLGWQDEVFVQTPKKEKKSNGLDISSFDIIDIMELARAGDKDAVLYCAQHKIDPFNSDSDFLFDYNELKVGDWYYEDGSFSRMKSDLKKCVGVVFSLNTSPLEQSEGWTHGLIVAIKSVKEREWGDSEEELPYPHTHYGTADMENLEKAPTLFKDYQTEFLLRDSNITAFKAAKKCRLPLPEKRTSGWFLPSITQLKQIVCNLSGDMLTKISMSCGHAGHIWWSSSQSNANEACYIYISVYEGNASYSFGTSRKIFPYDIRPIAAF